MLSKLKNIPTALTLREARLLERLSENSNSVLEVGSLFGYSTLLLSSADRVISVDPHKGYPCREAPSTYKRFLGNLEKFSGGNVEVVKDVYQNVDLSSKFDLAFVDLNGNYETTKGCLEKLSHIPLVVVHDFGRQNCKGVDRAVLETNRNLQVIDTCAILT